MEPHPDEHFHPGDEFLDWPGEFEGLKGTKPKGKYNKFSEHARTMISHEKACALFCGGKKCKYCTWENWEKDKMDINGLYSNWVTDNILAMARPSTKAIKKFKILEQFKEQGINTVINIQKPKEHADCGFGLEKSGFTYDPQELMDNGIFFYNFGWDDYGVASLSTILDMVKVIQFGVSQGKVAIHCHAGLGRTGVIIATYLVFNNRISADDAIQFVRSKRHGAIQTSGQMEVIREFELYLRPFRIIFAIEGTNSHEFSLQQFLNRQKHMLHGYEARRLKYVPKIIYVVCERLLELAKKGQALSQIRKSPSGVSLDKRINQNGDISQTNGVSRVTSQISLEAPKTSQIRRAQRKQSVCMEDLPNDKLLKLDHSGSGKTENDTPSTDPDTLSTSDLLSQKSDEVDLVSTELGNLTTNDVAEALGSTDIEEGVGEQADNYQRILNEKDSAWKELASEQNPHVLAEVMWSWLDHLKEPVLRAQDLSVIIKTRDVDTVLQKLERGTRHTIEYFLKIIYKLKPLSDEILTNIYEKLLSYLTHQWVMLDITGGDQLLTSWSMSTRDSMVETENREHWSEMKKSHAIALHTFFIQLQENIDKKLEEQALKKTDSEN